MPTYSVRKSHLAGILRIPPSKSNSMRAILFGSLCSGKTQLRNVLHSPDVEKMCHACRSVGAEIVDHGRGMFSIEGVAGKLTMPDDVIDAGNSGLVLRLFGAVAALNEGYTVITGDDSIRHLRPVTPLLDGLRQLGAWAESTRLNGHAPIIVKGPLQSGSATINAADSQPLSGLLIAAAFSSGTFEINIEDLGERPWLELTLAWLEHLGVAFENSDYKKILVEGQPTYMGFSYSVPADFSSAAYPIVAALITHSEISLTHLDLREGQGDKQLIDLLINMGAHIAFDPDVQMVTVTPSPALKGGKIDVNPFIDAITILPVIACFAKKETQIVNGAIARKKECDRIACITKELKKMGARIKETKDGMIVQPSKLRGAEVESYNDHRIAMSLAVAGLAASGKTTIAHTDCVKKSYPEFFNHLRFLGADVRLEV